MGKKITKIIIILMVLAVTVGMISINVRSALRQRAYDGHIEAAERYLLELSYEQAIVEYTFALEIEPKAKEALDALEQTSLEYAQSLSDVGDYKKAVDMLEVGYVQTGRKRLRQEMLGIVSKVFSKISFVKAGDQYISDERLDESIGWMIQVKELYGYSDYGSDDVLSQLYYYIGEHEKSEEYYKKYDNEGDWVKTDEGFISIQYDKQEDVKTEFIFDRYCFRVGLKHIFMKDGSLCEETYEHDEGGKLIRYSCSFEYNSPDAIEAIGKGSAHTDRSGSAYSVERVENIEYEYDYLGRKKTEEQTVRMVYSDGEIRKYSYRSTYTYHDENTFTEFQKSVSESSDGGGISEFSFLDYEIINEYGEWVCGEPYDQTFIYIE